MTTLDNRQLLNLIRYAPVAIVVIFSFAVILIVVNEKQEQAELSIQNLREELTFQRQQTIRSQVHQVHQHLLIEESRIKSQLKEAAKQRVYEAHSVASYIYAQNTDRPANEVQALIIEALRPMRFFKGRGYYFILADDGKTVLNSAYPELENKALADIEDFNATKISQSMLNATRAKGESYIHWHFKKPGSVGDELYEKLGYIKIFEPYNWAIATGEYLRDFEVDASLSLLDWFSNYEYDENGYFFVLDEQGKLLAHHVNDFFGVNFTIGKPVDGILFNEINRAIEEGGGFIRFSKPITLSGDTTLEQISYVKKIPEWNWIIGTGFSSKAFENNLRQKELELTRQNDESLKNLVYLAITSIFLLTMCSLFIGNVIARRFNSYQKKIKNDFAELQQTKDALEYTALHDSLTGLPNRSQMLADLTKQIHNNGSQSDKLAVMFVDLVNFKNINDLYGHYTGDQLLVAISLVFKDLVSSKGTVSRFGGDEFVFCFPRLTCRDEAEVYAQQILYALEKPIIVETKALSVTCRIGVAIYPDDSNKADTLIKYADTALYTSKAEKKCKALFYSGAISKQLKRKIRIEEELALALENDLLSVHYQPQMTAEGEELVSVEALARWSHPDLGNIFPDEFIAVAEESGLIHELDLYIFRKACSEIQSLTTEHTPCPKLSVNISPAHLLEPDFLPRISETCQQTGISPEHITLEITENIFIHGFEAVQPLFNQLRKQGFGLSLDDFGTGYSSLSYINSLPLTEIKIDRTFTHKFLDSYQSDMLVRMIIGIGRLCGLKVVAEGVETSDQLKRLLSYECDLVQGYYFDRPLPIHLFAEKYICSGKRKAQDDYQSNLSE